MAGRRWFDPIPLHVVSREICRCCTSRSYAAVLVKRPRHDAMDLMSSRRSSEGDDLATAGSTPVRSASACRGLGIHGLVTTSDVVERDPEPIAQFGRATK